jgi:hypothetical protein
MSFDNCFYSKIGTILGLVISKSFNKRYNDSFNHSFHFMMLVLMLPVNYFYITGFIKEFEVMGL